MRGRVDRADALTEELRALRAEIAPIQEITALRQEMAPAREITKVRDGIDPLADKIPGVGR